MPRLICKLFYLLLGTLTLAPVILAHEMHTSYSLIDIQSDQLTYSLTFDQKALEGVLDLDQNGDNKISQVEVDVNRETIYSYFENKVTLTTSGQQLVLSRSALAVSKDELGNEFVNVTFTAQLDFQPWKLVVGLDFFKDFGPLHKNLAKITAGDELHQAIFTIDSSHQAFSLTGGNSGKLGHAWQFLKLGVEHIVIGYDHILFLMGLIIIGGSLSNLFKIITSFTVAHSITLILAALQLILIPSRVVESIIALSIVYIAVENFFIQKTDDRWLITFVFGLMHGFGFASVLQELGLPSNGLVVSLLSFNVGVEIGQIAIIVLTFPIICLIKQTRWQRQIVYGLSSVIMAFGVLWFVERAFALNLAIL